MTSLDRPTQVSSTPASPLPTGAPRELYDRPAPMSASEAVPEPPRDESPLRRYDGPRAEEAHLRAEVEARRALGDAAGERAASIALARLLSARGIDLELAATLAGRALALQDEPALRAELAGVLSGLGEPALAATTLRGLLDLAAPPRSRASIPQLPAGPVSSRRGSDPSRPTEAARTLVKIAVLLSRADDLGGAVQALREAAAADPVDAMASELLGTLAAWAPAVVSPEAAAASYLEAARRREAVREKEAAFEDRLRAFEIAPEDPASAAAMAAALVGRGRPAASDEVMRAHAKAMATPEATQEVHRRRVQAALSEGDPVRALGAALDGGFDGALEGDDAAQMDDVLARAGLHELLAVRLELRAEGRRGKARSEGYEALARLCAGPLASQERAVEAWIEALAADAENAAARAALRDHASTSHDPGPLVEALLRAGENEGLPVSTRIPLLRELAVLAEEKLFDAGLAGWAFARVARASGDEEQGRAEEARLAPRLRQQAESLLTAQRVLGQAVSSDARVKAHRRLAAIYRGHPDEPEAYLETLAALARAQPLDATNQTGLERTSFRSGKFGPLEEVLRERLAWGAPRPDLIRGRLTLAAIERRRGSLPRALDECRELLVEAPGHRGAAGLALVLAARLGLTAQRADALVQLAAPAWPALRSVLLAAAAELYARAADHPLAGQAAPAAGAAVDLHALARRAAEQACDADPSGARAVATLAAVASRSSDRAAATAVERAMGIVLPRGSLCDALAQALEALGEAPLALAWTQRWLALRPGSSRAMAELLRRATGATGAPVPTAGAIGQGAQEPGADASADAAPSRLAEAVAWVLGQPKPLGDLAAKLVLALRVLFERDPARARTLARRALDVVGPRNVELRVGLLELADRVGDRALGISVLERQAAAEASGDTGGALLLELSARRIAANDLDGAARELCLAAGRSVGAKDLLARADAIEAAAREVPGGLGSDGLVALQEARLAALEALALDPESRLAAARCLRELASLKWDLVGDQEGAEAALFSASELVPGNRSVERYVDDLATLAGPEEAMSLLFARAGALRESGDARRVAHLLIETAALAQQHALHEPALRAASSALALDPTRTDALGLVEHSAHVEGGIAVLDACYERLATAALGCYGRRAAHHRAARQLEGRGELDLALKHAIACFEAVPSDGAQYALLARLAQRSTDPTEAVRAIERVAASGDSHGRTAWLKRAASLAGKTEDGARLRFDVLLGAIRVRAEASTVVELGRAIQDIVGRAGDSEMVGARFERAVRAALSRLDGPEGSRAAVAMAKVALELGASGLALDALSRAMTADGDIEEFAVLLESTAGLAADPDAAASFIAGVRTMVGRPYSSVGPTLLRLAAAMATTLGDAPTAGVLLVQAVRRATDDDALVDAAEAAVSALGDPWLRKQLDEALPAGKRLQLLLRVAEEHDRAGRREQAIAALQRARGWPDLPADERRRVFERLHRLFGASLGARREGMEGLLRQELARDGLREGERVGLARELGELLLQRGDPRGALEVLAPAVAHGHAMSELLGDVRRLARQTGDLQTLEGVLQRLVASAPTDAVRLELLRELGPLAVERGGGASASTYYEAIAQLDPPDPKALEDLEAAAEARGDHPTIAALLARRIASGAGPTRTLRLRRAAVLEQRLGRVEEAKAELEAQLAEDPNDTAALRYLADVFERLGEHRAAGATLRRLVDLAPAADEKADYGLRACTSYLAGDDVAAAQALLEAIAPVAQRESILVLRVQIARKLGDRRATGDALDQLATSSREPAAQRADLLLDAARAASAIGDEGVALDRARRAAKLAPQSADAVLEARRLEYLAAGTGTPREAQAAVDDLTGIAAEVAAELGPSAVALHAFLLAEELDVIQGGGAGMRELSRRHAEVGPLPLLALGMAERLVRSKNFETALPLFEQALGGDLQGVRARGRVALAAAEAAVSAGDFDAATRLLEQAASEPLTRAQARRLQLEVLVARGEPDAARRALAELARSAEGIDRARVLVQMARLLEGRDPETASRALLEAAPLAAVDRGLSAQIAEALTRLEGPHRGPLREAPPGPAASSARAAPGLHSPSPPAPPSHAPFLDAPGLAPKAEPPAPGRSDPPAAGAPRLLALPPPLPVPTLPASLRLPLPLPALVAPKAPEVPATEVAAPELPPSPEAPALPDADSAPLSVLRRSVEGSDERTLLVELSNGSFEAGEELIVLYQGSAGSLPVRRAHDAVAVRRLQAWIRPGDAVPLARLREAAQLDGDTTYGRAIEHVLAVGDAASAPVLPPPLSAQRDQPELVTSLLFRSVTTAAAHEALALVCETGLYKGDMGKYRLSGVERVQGAATVLGDLHAACLRLLGVSRTPLFHRRDAIPPEARVVLLAPPAVVVTGEIRQDTPELRYLLGSSLAAAMPENALMNGLTEESVRTLFEALLAAFGPVGKGSRSDPAVARLAQNLWQVLPPRAERRMREIFSEPTDTEGSPFAYERVLGSTRQGMRRAGLFTSGDLQVTLRAVGAELSVSLEDYLRHQGGLARACAEHPAIADLVRLAARAEFAAARWLSGGAPRRP